MTLVIAGERSGVGKTTVTLALLAYLRSRSRSVQSFKVGPDYIDPMFHGFVTGRPCRNLDPRLTSETYVQQCFVRHAQGVSYALVEGVMGLFDGAAGEQDYASTAHVARLLSLPVLLVLDCSRLSHSIAALVHGYRSFDPRIQLAGVVLNRVGSDRHLELLKSALEPLNIPILGVLRRQPTIAIPDRHLGLIPTGELEQLNSLIHQLATIAETSFDWSQILPLLEVSLVGRAEGASNQQVMNTRNLHQRPIRIAIAQDAAFNFYYADNLEQLETLGAELVPWSPLKEGLPEHIQGLYLGGGFPEVFAGELADNSRAQAAVRSAIVSGMPTYAECGGLMYLCQQITGFEGQSWPMVGILPTTAVMGPRLTLGYRQVEALQEGPLLLPKAIVWGHEFHRSYLTVPPQSPLFQVVKGSSDASLTFEGWQLNHLHASYIHLHWGTQPELPQRFLQHCIQYAALTRDSPLA